jgi:hypothetical protein
MAEALLSFALLPALWLQEPETAVLQLEEMACHSRLDLGHSAAAVAVVIVVAVAAAVVTAMRTLSLCWISTSCCVLSQPCYWCPARTEGSVSRSFVGLEDWVVAGPFLMALLRAGQSVWKSWLSVLRENRISPLGLHLCDAGCHSDATPVEGDPLPVQGT